MPPNEINADRSISSDGKFLQSAEKETAKSEQKFVSFKVPFFRNIAIHAKISISDRSGRLIFSLCAAK